MTDQRDERSADEERWLGVDEVAERLRLDTGTVRDWFAEGRLPGDSCDAAGNPRVRAAALDAFLLEQQ